MAGKTVILGVTGCIAAYKAVEVMRGLQREGAAVRVVMTRSAQRFVAPLTFEALSGQAVVTDMFRRGQNLAIEHIHAAQEADVLAVVPATANILGKFAHGIADDFLSTLYLSCPAPVVLAPAMNVEMWRHPAVQANAELLRARGDVLVDPEAGNLACGMWGDGRLAGVETIVSAVFQAACSSKLLAGLRVLVTAGPTVEDIDPVRFLSNRSSGRMGYALAQAARANGGEVVLVSGPTHLAPPAGVRLVRVRSASEMKAAVLENFPAADIAVMAAAVSDYRPAETAPSKLKKGAAEMVLSLAANDDILEILGARRGHQVLVGFAAETENLIENARRKMIRKGADIVAANDVARGVFGEERATVHLLARDAEPVALVDLPKLEIAHRILEAAAALLDRPACARAAGPDPRA